MVAQYGGLSTVRTLHGRRVMRNGISSGRESSTWVSAKTGARTGPTCGRSASTSTRKSSERVDSCIRQQKPCHPPRHRSLDI